MHKVAIYRRYAYQSPNHRPRWSFVLTIFKTTHHVNKHEIVFHNLYGLTSISPSDSALHRSFAYYNGIVGNTSVADGALILHMIS